jgi:hypothetical protein
MIVLPANWSTYYAEIKDRCINLIAFKIWNGIELDRFNRWLKNFETDEEKYLSACILDSLMYRSNSKTKALIYHLFNVVLPNFTRLNPTPIGQIDDWFSRLKSQTVDPMVRLVAVIADEDPPTKSTHHILRMLSKEFQIHEGWLIFPHKLKYHVQSGVKTFVFIDDFMGSGQQFNELVLEHDLHNHKEIQTIYAPLVAHEKGCDYIQARYHGKIKVTCSEYLQADINFFDNYFPGQQESARQFYLDMLKSRGISSVDPINAFGYGNLQFAYSFEHACPDNSLSALWKRNDSWSPLFNR